MLEEQIECAQEMNVDFIIYDSLLATNVIKKVDSHMQCLIDIAIQAYKRKDALLNVYNRCADIVGSNCECGPDKMLQLLRDTKNKLDVNTNKIPIAAFVVS